MTAPETKAVIAALTAGGAEVRFVGGCVRDAAIGRAVTDVDIATHDLPETVIELLQAARLKVVPTGLKHGTVTAVVKGQHFEITTLRRDVETFGRHARVEFTDDWAADAARRDFTMNAMFLGIDGTLYDPFGGLADLRAGRVRFVGDARQRIKEDVLRLLRFFRFHARYGRGAPDAEGLAACRALAPLLPTLSAERVRDETLKLLRAPAPADVLRLMAREDILARYLPEAHKFERLAALTALPTERDAPDGLRRLAAVLDVDGAGAREVATRLRFSNAEIKRLGAALGASAGLHGAGRWAGAAARALRARRRALSRSRAVGLGGGADARRDRRHALHAAARRRRGLAAARAARQGARRHGARRQGRAQGRPALEARRAMVDRRRFPRRARGCARATARARRRAAGETAAAARSRNSRALFRQHRHGRLEARPLRDRAEPAVDRARPLSAAWPSGVAAT